LFGTSFESDLIATSQTTVHRFVSFLFYVDECIYL
jgi:hypothetical protein